MKKLFSFLFVLSFAFTLTVDSIAQSFYTGAIGVTQSNGGRTRIFSDNLITRQIDRASILVGVSSTAVFDYAQDQNSLINAATVASPTMSDYEVTSTIDNTYSNLPPNVEVAINLYGWTNGAYILAKMNVKNREASAIDAVIGLEVHPQVDGAYGGETVQYDAVSKSVFLNKTRWVGLKFFSGLQTSFETFEYFSGFANDASFYSWLTQNSFDAPYTAGGEGAVVIMGQDPINILPGNSVDFYFGIALGTDQSSCIDNLNLCEQKFNLIVPVELLSFTANAMNNKITLNWSTATELNNRGFEVERKVNDNSNWVTIGFKEGYGTTTQVQNYSFIDDVSGVQAEKIYYRLKQVDFDGTFTYSNEVEISNFFVPTNLVLDQNYPNPFNPTTKISFGLPERSNVVLKVFNLIGEEVALITSGSYEAGTYYFNFDASKLPSGVYIYSLQTNNSTISKKMTLMK